MDANGPQVLVVPMHPGIQYHFARSGLPIALLGHWDQFRYWRPQPGNVRNLLPAFKPEQLNYSHADYRGLLDGLGEGAQGCTLAWLHFPWQVKLFWDDTRLPKIYFAAKHDELAPETWARLLDRPDFTVASYYPLTTAWIETNFGRRVVEIELGLDPEEYAGWTGEDAQVLTVIHSWKDRGWNHHYYAAAVEGLAAVHVDHLDRTKAPIDYPTLRALFRRSRVYLHDGEREYTIALIEAMMTGMPIVSFDQPGIGSYVEHGVNGFVVRDGRDARECCRMLLDDAALAARMGAASRAKALARHHEARWRDDWWQLARAVA